MELLAYGEDALTFWAVTSKLALILQILKDSSTPASCRVFYRPSFGRSGGDTSSQFGEFDFMLLAEQRLYLGESKWNNSTEKVEQGVLSLREEQILRHEIFRFYVEEWAFGEYQDWEEFREKGRAKLYAKRVAKPIAPANSLLATNLQTVLEVIKKHYPTRPIIKNILLYLHGGIDARHLPRKAGMDFEVVPIDYSGNRFDNFIKIQM